MTLRRKYHSFTQIPLAVRWLMPITWVLLGLSRVIVLLLPFRKLAPLLGCRADAPVLPLVAPQHLQRLRNLKQLIAITSHYCPWKANCFAQAITAKVWLSWWGLPYTLFFGVARDPAQQLKAHAWLIAGPVVVCGGNSFAQFTVVASYVSQPFSANK
ncbi:lasso peptide biosynthesis B2 protein [Rheinheimera sp. UJ63]|uniref:lasso peptide biosynthesis B2 protein n=1 Tax=Rheinheimera sp. UJ63 TaxID=2910157 RepID=UPI001F181F06|nr:lasso peptide biosynthesis B2 protein [Rheinheimera sp. UJ63]MCF4009291.1 lasso peptide biosynthesis B2 protein [Rheinheimera sp. UJ63]